MLGPVGGGILFIVAYLVSLILLTGFHPFEIVHVVKHEFAEFFERRSAMRDAYFEPNLSPPAPKRKRARAKPAVVDDGLDEEFEPKPARKRAKAKAPKTSTDDLDDKPPFDMDPLPPEPKRPEPKIIDANERKPRPTKPPTTLGDTLGGSFGPIGDQFKNYKLPSLDLLAYDDEEEEPTDKGELIRTQSDNYRSVRHLRRESDSRRHHSWSVDHALRGLSGQGA